MSAKYRSDTRLTGYRLRAARGLWVVVALVSVTLFVTAASARVEDLSVACVSDPCIPLQATREGAQILERELNLPLRAYASMVTGMEAFWAVVFLMSGLVIFWRRSDDWMAILVSLVLLMAGTGVSALAQAIPEAQPALGPLVGIWQGASTALLTVLLFLFPSGEFEPRWTRWAAGTVILLMLGLALSSQILAPIWFITILAGTGTGLYAQIYRYREVSTPVERQQTKWVLFGFEMFFIGAVAIALPQLLFSSSINPLNEPTASVADFLYRVPYNFTLAFLPIAMLPVSIAISTLRYRLWDADLVITRSLVYGALSGILVAVYLISALFIEGLFQTLSGEESPLAIVASTLIIAALFTPLRRRLQRLIDRRFYRRKYNAEKTLAEFSAFVRDEVEIGPITEELLGTVQRSIQPQHVSLWLRGSD